MIDKEKRKKKGEVRSRRKRRLQKPTTPHGRSSAQVNVSTAILKIGELAVLLLMDVVLPLDV